MSQFNAYRPKLRGPAGGEILTCSFSLSTSTLTKGECQGTDVSRSTTGTYVVAFAPGYFKKINVGMSVQAASTAQLFIITARDLAAGTLTLKQVTAGGGTAVDTITAQVDLVIVGRTQD